MKTQDKGSFNETMVIIMIGILFNLTVIAATLLVIATNM